MAVAVPAIHVAACTVFLLGYSWGFGENIETLFSITDFFRISMQRLAMMYVLGLGFPLALITYRHKIGITYYADRIEREPDNNVRALLVDSHERSRSKIRLVSPAIAIGIILLLITQINYGLAPDYYIMFSLTETALLPLWFDLCNRGGFYGRNVELVYAVVIFFTSVFSIGLEAGGRDRHMQYHTSTGYTCSKNRIINAVGSRFISVGPDNGLKVITDECRTIFEFKKVAPYRDESVGRLLWQSLRSEFRD